MARVARTSWVGWHVWCWPCHSMALGVRRVLLLPTSRGWVLGLVCCAGLGPPPWCVCVCVVRYTVGAGGVCALLCRCVSLHAGRSFIGATCRPHPPPCVQPAPPLQGWLVPASRCGLQFRHGGGPVVAGVSVGFPPVTRVRVPCGRQVPAAGWPALVSVWLLCCDGLCCSAALGALMCRCGSALTLPSRPGRARVGGGCFGGPSRCNSFFLSFLGCY